MNLSKMKRFLTVSALICCASSQAASFSNWQFRQEFEIQSPGLIKLSLPPDTLDAARSDLGDLRLADGAGNEIPYLIERAAPVGRVVQNAKSFKVELDQESTVITLETGLAQALGAVRLFTPSVNFIKAVTVSGSTDGTTWKTLATGRPIFQQPTGSTQLRVELPPEPWALLRITVDDRASPPVAFTGAEVEAAEAETVSLETAAVQILERVENPGETRLTLNLGAAHLPLAAIEIESTDPLFNRQITLAARQVEDNTVREKPLVGGSIYRVAVAGQTPSARLSLPLVLQTPTRDLALIIHNGDSPPLQISAIRAKRWPTYLLFFAPASGRFALLTGNPLCPAPHYDLANQGISVKTTPPSQIVPSAIAGNPSYSPSEALPRVPDSGAVLDVSQWRFRKRVILQSPGVHQIDLDLPTLSHSQPNLADLRLCRDGRQLPFIIEQTSDFRRLQPEVSRSDDSQRPKLSRWQLKLPHANLPLTRLTCTSPSPLFRRDVILYEEPADERGAKYRRDLGTASWVQAPDHSGKTFVVTLTGRPTTDTLFLETNNEDNPPIELADLELAWPATRLFLKTAANENVFMFYGNATARTPQYDLSLVANQLLLAEKQNATLGPEEQLKKPSWAERRTPGQTGFLFWGALVLVVGALLFLIARMIPKDANQSRHTE
jgi:hypothetical protein